MPEEEKLEQPEAIIQDGEPETPTPVEVPEVPEKDNSDALRQVTARAKKAEAEAKAAKAEAERLRQANTKGLDVEDYIDISASLEGLDQREKEHLAELHKLTGKPLNELRQGEDFSLWRTGHNLKKEKELALKPSGTQPESDKPMSFAEKLKGSSLADKEKLLTDAGLYRSPRPRADRVDLGRGK